MITKLLGLQYRIIYKKGPDNRTADALSRRWAEGELSAVSMGLPLWLEDVQKGYRDDAQAKKLLAHLAWVYPSGWDHLPPQPCVGGL